MPLADGQVFAGYTILRILGAGGMGEVYLAEHPRLPRRDALKVLGAAVSHDEEYRQRFNQEAEMVATLRHPHIVTIYDRGEADDKLWIAMEFVDGIDAGRLLQDKYPKGIPPAEVVRIVGAVAEALDYAHSRKLLHRDIKPANILLGTPGSADDRVMLADFGVARWIDQASDLTGAEMTVGTVTYAAPEQLKGERIDGRADQYALAATAFHLLTGAAPFSNSNPAVVISKHLSAAPPSIDRADLSGFGPVFVKALAKNPAGRFGNCRDFARAMGQALGAPPGGSARHRKSGSTSVLRRRWLPAVLGTALAGAAVGAAVWLLTHDDRPAARPQPAAPPPAASSRMDLPVVVMGADCAVLGAAAVDADGTDAYCARVNSQGDQTVWSRIPERLRTAVPPTPAIPNPASPTPAPQLPTSQPAAP
ncbi:MAG: serine/threonine protein kinase [Mycobacterium sp.]|nr:serine/threonine protein kinase [Mycobacterium sp.]